MTVSLKNDQFQFNYDIGLDLPKVGEIIKFDVTLYRLEFEVGKDSAGLPEHVSAHECAPVKPYEAIHLAHIAELGQAIRNYDPNVLTRIIKK